MPDEGSADNQIIIELFAKLVHAIDRGDFRDAEFQRKALLARGWICSQRPGSGRRALIEPTGPAPELPARSRRLFALAVLVLGLSGFWQESAGNDTLHKAKKPGGSIPGSSQW